MKHCWHEIDITTFGGLPEHLATCCWCHKTYTHVGRWVQRHGPPHPPEPRFESIKDEECPVRPEEEL